MEEKIPYWKSNRFLGAFIRKEGEQGCLRCPDEDVRLSIDCLPPPLRDQPPAPKVRKQIPQKKKREKHEFLLNVLSGMTKVLETKRRFRAWIDSPNLPRTEPVKEAVVEVNIKIPPFDIQEIPTAIRALGMPKAALMFEKWFSGELNYSLNTGDSREEINQNGEPYPASMIDKTSISMKWILAFGRAERAYLELINTRIYTPAAKKTIAKILSRHRNKMEFNALHDSGGDVQALHREYQFQFSGVEASLSQKLSQYLTREVTSFGIPDELTLILGSFNLFAAIGRVSYDRRRYGNSATVTHIYVYARDGFTFTDDKAALSQYLGHWNKNSIAIVAATEASIILGKVAWFDFPIAPNSFSTGVDMMYPVKNKDFRDWQLRHKQGGDYMIYTDAKVFVLRTPITVVLDEGDVYVPEDEKIIEVADNNFLDDDGGLLRT